MATDDPLITVAELEAFIGHDVDAGQAEELIALASAAVRDECGWHIAPPVDETLTLDGSGTYTQELPSMWVTAITDVTENGTTLDLDTLEWSRRGQVRRKCRSHFTDAFGGLSVTLNHGLDAAPGAVKAAVLSAVQRAMIGDPGVQSDSVRVGQLSKTRTYATGGDATVGTVDLSNNEKAALGRWMLPSQQGDG